MFLQRRGSQHLSYLSLSVDLVNRCNHFVRSCVLHVWHHFGDEDLVVCPRACTVFLVTTFFRAGGFELFVSTMRRPRSQGSSCQTRDCLSKGFSSNFCAQKEEVLNDSSISAFSFEVPLNTVREQKMLIGQPSGDPHGVFNVSWATNQEVQAINASTRENAH